MKPWEHAFPMMDAGHPCFPVASNAKAPTITGGYKRATTNPEEFRRLLAEFGDPNANYAVSTANLIAIDIDPKKGGIDTIKAISDQFGNPLGYEFPATLTVRTPSGGWHLYYAIAAGVPWMGRKVQQGAVVYIAAEGGGAIQKRGAALRIHHQTGQRSVPLAIVPSPVDLSGAGADVAPIVDLVAEVEAATSQRVILIVVDTLARAIGGDNENSPDGMGAFVRNVDKIRDATRAHLLIVHHSGKDKAKGARGHSSLRAATDTELEVGTIGERAADDRIVTVTKQRDMDQGPAIGFDLKPVEIGHDADGNAVTSCVVVPRLVAAPDPFAPKFVPVTSVAGQALAVLQGMITGRPNAPETVPVRTWREEFINRYYPGQVRVGATAFRRAEQKLRESNRLFVDGESVRAVMPDASSVKRAS